jgi:hypothetical protein
MVQCTLETVNSCLNINIYSYLETSGGQSPNLYLNAVHFLIPVLIRHLLQLKAVISLHWCLMHPVLLVITSATGGIFCLPMLSLMVIMSVALSRVQ